MFIQKSYTKAILLKASSVNSHINTLVSDLKVQFTDIFIDCTLKNNIPYDSFYANIVKYIPLILTDE